MMKQKGKEEALIAASSSGRPPPPPPPPPTRHSIATPPPTPPSSRTTSVQPVIPEALVPRSRSRTTSATRPPLVPPGSRQVSPVPIPINRDPSLPRPVSADPIARPPSLPPRPIPRSVSADSIPVPPSLPSRPVARPVSVDPIPVPSSRAPSAASTTDYRSRSRHKPEPPRAASVEPIPTRRDPYEVSRAKSEEATARHTILPIHEEGARRGRSPIRKAHTHLGSKAMALLRKKQQLVQAEGQQKIHLGRFAKKIQAAQRVTASVPPSKIRDYDDIERAVQEDPSGGGLRKKIVFPESAFFHRQRVDSTGAFSLRHRGRPIV